MLGHTDHWSKDELGLRKQLCYIDANSNVCHIWENSCPVLGLDLKFSHLGSSARSCNPTVMRGGGRCKKLSSSHLLDSLVKSKRPLSLYQSREMGAPPSDNYWEEEGEYASDEPQ